MAMGAAKPPDIAVQFKDVTRAGLSMKAVDILCDEAKTGHLRFERSDGMMCGVGRFSSDHLPAPVVPFPDKPWIPFKRFRRREVFRSEITPQAVSPAKGRDAAVRGDASAGQNRDCAG